MALVLRSAIGSDVGRERAGNQDAGAAGPRLLVVADGMGGHAHGELASSLTVAALVDMDDRLPDDLADVDLPTALAAALADAARRLDAGARRDPTSRGMGTTAVALLLDDTRLGVLHIGDSRIYRLRDGVLTQITHDHTVVQALVDEGRITPEEAARHPRRSVLLRALQAGHDPDPEVWLDSAIAGDRYLLCSDGVTAVLPDALLHELLAADREPADVVRDIINLANEGGGPDNITCIVARVVEGSADTTGKDTADTADTAGDRARVLAGAAAAEPEAV
jgi:protein phosphatase